MSQPQGHQPANATYPKDAATKAAPIHTRRPRTTAKLVEVTIDLGGDALFRASALTVNAAATRALKDVLAHLQARQSLQDRAAVYVTRRKALRCSP